MLIESLNPERFGQRKEGMDSRESLSEKLEKCGGTPVAPKGIDSSFLIDQMLEQARISAISNFDEVPAESLDDEAESVGTLHHAASFGEVELVEEIIRAGVDVEQRCKDGSTSLHLAAREGKTDVVMLLLERGAGVNSLDKFGSTPLHLAAVKGHASTVQKLLERGGSPGSRVWGDSGLGETPLHRAACIGDMGITRLLVDSPRAQKQRVELVMMRDEDGETPMHSAARWGHTEVVSMLVGAGGDVNALADDNNSPLHWAAKEGHAECIKGLLEFGANPKERNEDGDTPLLLAASRGQVEACRIILDALEGHPERASHLSWSLEAAVKMDHPKTTALLLGASADPDTRTEEGIPLLHVACREGHVEVVHCLLAGEATVTAASEYDGSTPLHMAAQEDHADLAALLLAKGAGVDQRQEDGSTPLHTAAASASLGAIDVLLRRGADVRAANTHMWTPLHSAAMVGSLEAVQVLLGAGADHRAINSMGEAAAHLAERGSYWEVVSALQMREALDDLGFDTPGVGSGGEDEDEEPPLPPRPSGPMGMGAEDPWEVTMHAREARETLKRRISRLSGASSGSARYRSSGGYNRSSTGEGMDCVAELAELMSEVMSEDVPSVSEDRGGRGAGGGGIGMPTINMLAPPGVPYFSPNLPTANDGGGKGGAGAEASTSQPRQAQSPLSPPSASSPGASPLGPHGAAAVGNRKPRWISGRTANHLRRRRSGRRDTWAPTLPKPTAVTPGGSRAAHHNSLERARKEHLGSSSDNSPVHLGCRKRGEETGGGMSLMSLQPPPKPDLLDDLWAQEWTAMGSRGMRDDGDGVSYPPPDGFGFGSDESDGGGGDDEAYASPSQSKRSRESSDDVDVMPSFGKSSEGKRPGNSH